MDIRTALPQCAGTLGVVLSLHGGLASAEPAGEVALAQRLWSQGQADSALTVITNAFRKDSTLAAVAMTYATLCVSDSHRARQLYRAVSADTAASDSLRAEALLRLACLAEHAHATDSVRQLLGRAADLHSSARLRRHLERAGVDLTSASNEARPAEHETAAPASVKKPSAVPASASDTQLADFSKAVSPADHPDPVAQTRYTLQAGAFSSAANAARLHEELQKSFGSASIDTNTSAGAILYRVRIGLFDTEEQALSWGEQKLAPKNLSFRAITISSTVKE